MRFVITDRANGQTVVAYQPRNERERQSLKAAIKNLSVLGQRGGCLNGL